MNKVVKSPFAMMLVAAVSLCHGMAAAQTYPARPVRLIVAFAPGGAADIIGRIIAAQLSEQWGEQIVVDYLAARLAEFIRAHAEMCADWIVPIPSTQKERPYDPVPLLARALGKAVNVAVSETALVKTRATRLQKEMTNPAQKQANVQGAFGVVDPNAVRDKCVLLLDDFYDSGVTLAEATRVLLAAGAAEVYVLTVTKTIHAD